MLENWQFYSYQEFGLFLLILKMLSAELKLIISHLMQNKGIIYLN